MTVFKVLKNSELKTSKQLKNDKNSNTTNKCTDNN